MPHVLNYKTIGSGDQTQYAYWSGPGPNQSFQPIDIQDITFLLNKCLIQSFNLKVQQIVVSFLNRRWHKR